MEGDVLCIGERRWDLSKKRHVYLLGAGKACNHMAMALDELLGGGILNSGLYLLAARPGMGKTTLALNIAARATQAHVRDGP